jgi:hypothetical protein
VIPWFNRLVLTEETLSALRTDDVRMALGELGTLYHEATHAWLDLEERGYVTALRLLSKGHYAGSPLEVNRTQIGVADDPNRIFQEAAGSYVEHRVVTWLRTLRFLEVLARDPEVNTAHIGPSLEKVRAEYDAEMSRRVFGYEDEGGFLGFGSEQAYTTRPIRNDLRAYLDTAVLEGRIPDRFEQDPRLHALAAEAARRAQRGGR